MKLRTKIRTLAAVTLLTAGSQLFAAEAEYNIGVADGVVPVGDGNVTVTGTEVSYADFFGITLPGAGATTQVDLTGGVDKEFSGTVGGKSFTAVFTVSSSGNQVTINEHGQMGPNGSPFINKNNKGPLTFIFKEMKAGSDPSVSFAGFTTVAATASNGNGAVKINKDASDGGANITVVNRPNFVPQDVTAITDTDSRLRIDYVTKSYTILQIGAKFSAPDGDVEITGYDAISAPDAGFVNDSNFTDGAAVIAALPTTATISGTSATVPLSWADTDSYDNTTAGSYTFTATIGSLPAGYVDDLDTISTIEVEVVEAAVTEITGYDAVAAPNAGSIQNPVFADEAAVAAALGTQITATEDDALVDVTWASSPAYATTAGTYTFTATPSSYPAGYVDNVNPQTVTVDVVVAKADYITSAAQLDNAVLGSGGAVKFDAIFGDLTPASATATGSVYIVLENDTANEKLYKVDLTVTAEDTDGATTIGSPAADPLRLGVGTSGADTYIEATESLKIEVTSVTSGGSASSKFFGLNGVFIGNATGEKGFITDKDDTQVNVLTPSPGFINFSDSNTFDGEIPTSFVQVNGVSGGGVINNITFDFADPTLTPALDVNVEQTGKLIEWRVREEIAVDYYELIDAEGNVVAVKDADGSDAYSITLDEYVEVKLVVVDESGKKSNPYTPDNGNQVTATYNLTTGWNLISVAGDNADLSAIEAATIGTLWGWDGSKYVETDAQTAYTGVWVYSDNAQTVSAVAVKADATLELKPGWTLAGPANTVAVPEAVTVFEWNGSYSPTVSLDMGVGYWFFTPETITITLDSE